MKSNLGHTIDAEVRACTILIVEDSSFNLQFLEKILRKNGFCKIITANNGAQALELVQEKMPDLIVLDMIMPKMDGFEFLERLRENKGSRNIPVLVQTGLTNPDKKMKIFESGANDLIFKPIEAKELVARITVQLERQVMLSKLQDFKVTMEEELSGARKLVNSILPTEEEIQKQSDKYAIDTNVYFESSTYVGGDLWNIRAIDEDRVLVYVIDVSGHGVAAAMNAMRLHMIATELTNENIDPGAFLSSINAVAYKFFPVQDFATMFCAVFDVKKNTMSYASAASTTPLLINVQNESVSMLNPKGHLLCVKSDTEYETRHAEFPSGSGLLLYSDALVESKDKDGQFFTETMLENIILEELKNKDKKDIDKQIFSAIMEEFDKKYKLNIRDDLTVTMYYKR
jgi:phosphoserine phosphatase RsbU/P